MKLTGVRIKGLGERNYYIFEAEDSIEHSHTLFTGVEIEML